MKSYCLRASVVLILMIFINSIGITQVNYPGQGIVLGQKLLENELVAMDFPESDFIVVQFCSEPSAPIKTKYYLDFIKDQGVEIIFVGVFHTLLYKKYKFPTPYKIWANWDVFYQTDYPNMWYALSGPVKVHLYAPLVTE